MNRLSSPFGCTVDLPLLAFEAFSRAPALERFSRIAASRSSFQLFKTFSPPIHPSAPLDSLYGHHASGDLRKQINMARQSFMTRLVLVSRLRFSSYVLVDCSRIAFNCAARLSCCAALSFLLTLITRRSIGFWRVVVIAFGECLSPRNKERLNV